MNKLDMKSLRAGEFGDIGDCDERRQRLLEIEYRLAREYSAKWGGSK